MKRAAEETTALVYAYGCGTPVEGLDAAEGEVARCRALWDTLVEIERNYDQAQHDAACRASVEYAHTAALIGQISGQINTLVEQRRAQRAQARARIATEQDAPLRAAFERRNALRKELWFKNDLRRPTMEEIGYRTSVFTLDGIAGHQREYIAWLLKQCASDAKTAGKILVPEVIDLLAERLHTPLQIEQHLKLAVEEGFRLGERPVSAAVVESVLSKQLNDLEPTLRRHGYDAKRLAEQFGAKQAEIKSWFAGRLEPARARELQEQMLAAGLPI